MSKYVNAIVVITENQNNVPDFFLIFRLPLPINICNISWSFLSKFVPTEFVRLKTFKLLFNA